MSLCISRQQVVGHSQLLKAAPPLKQAKDTSYLVIF
jgi:hypothetical protein